MIEILCCAKCMYSLIIKEREVVDTHMLRAYYYCPHCKEVKAVMVTYTG